MARSSEEWLSLQKASARIGVSPATLRSWADGGRVKTFRTPGGHRRFRAQDVNSLAAAPTRADSRWRLLENSALGKAHLAVEPKDRHLSWYEALTPNARIAHREIGRKMVRLLIDILSGRVETEGAHARALGKEYAQLERRLGINLTDAVEGFVFFRSTFLESVMEFGRGIDGLKAAEIVEWLYRLNAVIDDVLVGMIENYAHEPRR